jgi:hypothetical protein
MGNGKNIWTIKHNKNHAIGYLPFTITIRKYSEDSER